MDLLDELPVKLSEFIPKLKELGEEVQHYPSQVADRVATLGHTMQEKMKAIRFTAANSQMIQNAAPSIETLTRTCSDIEYEIKSAFEQS